MELNEHYLVNKYGKERLKELEKLDLRIIGIKNIEPNAFKELKRLKTIKLDNNEIAEIKTKSFINQESSLRILHLNNNKFKEIPLEIQYLSNLRELYLYGNMIKEININQLYRLVILDLGNNAIKEISEYLFESMIKLKVLKLNNNKIKKIYRHCLQPLKSIEAIQLYGNNLRNVRSYFLGSITLPISFYDVVSLKEFGFLSDWKNFLEQFPKVIYYKRGHKDRIESPEKLRSLEYNEEREREIMERERREREIRETERREIEERQRRSKEAQENEQRKQRLDKEKKPTTNSQNDQESSPSSNNKDRFDRYKMETMLGSGTYGVVYKVRDNQNNNQYKVMKMIKNVLNESAKMKLEKIMRINHENIVKYYDYFIYIGYIEYICIITEYCQNGNLEKKISEIKRHEGRKFSENEISDWMLQAADGLRYLHSNSIVHGDIKPSNMLLSERNIVKLVDTGIAKCIRESNRFDIYHSSLPYMSPEFLEENYHYHISTDIWSLGCILYELIHIRLAFPLGRKKTDIPSFAESGPFTRFLEKMIEIDPKVRMSSIELYEQLKINLHLALHILEPKKEDLLFNRENRERKIKEIERREREIRERKQREIEENLFQLSLGYKCDKDRKPLSPELITRRIRPVEDIGERQQREREERERERREREIREREQREIEERQQF